MKIVKIGIVGAGAIGTAAAEFIDTELKGKAVVAGICDQEKVNAEKLQKKISGSPRILNMEALVKETDLVIEAASVAAVSEVLEKALEFKKDAVILSAGGLLGKQKLLIRAQEQGIKIYVPSGAVCGIDGLGALRQGKIKKISLITSKPPAGLLGADYLKKKNIKLTGLKKERVIFEGGVKDAVRAFPKNINVAAVLLLASGLKDVQVCIKADPKIERNIHRIEIDAQEGKINIEVENVPSAENPKTSMLAVLSTKYLLKKMFSCLKIGS